MKGDEESHPPLSQLPPHLQQLPGYRHTGVPGTLAT